jgi:NAD-dependent dihydropyrimidine dehydrogenase PreA subunit
MVKPKIDQDKCTVCGKCVEICPVDVFEKKEDKVEVANPDACIGCRACEAQCPVKAIEMED